MRVSELRAAMSSGNENQPNSSPKPERRVEFKFPLLTIRTQAFSKVFDKLGSFRFSRYSSWVALAIVPIVAAIGLYFIVGSLFAMLSNPAIGNVTRQLGPGTILLLPGLNPLLPIAYGWLAIVFAIVIHEGAHGIVARSAGFRVKSSGLLFLLFIPIGAFVDVDEEQIKKAKPRASLRVMAAGVGGNVVAAAVCLIGVLLIMGTLSPLVEGVYINEVTAGMPAQAAGLQAKDVFISIEGVRINSTADLQNVLGNLTAGDIVQVVVARGDRWQSQFSTFVNLTTSENRTVMGVTIGDLVLDARLMNYQEVTLQKLPMYLVPPTLASGLVPFSDSLAPFYSSSLGDQWQILANVLFWIWFVNVNVAIFNALPLYPLDGGRMFDITIKGALGKKLSPKNISLITSAVTVACIIVVISVAVIPFIM